MGRGASDDTGAAARDRDVGASGGVQSAAQQVLARTLSELTDPEGPLADTIGSTYAIEVASDGGVLHILFRLDDGNEKEPEIVAVYFGGRAVVGVDFAAVEQIVTATCEESPGLFWDNH